MKILELFAGSRSIGKMAQGHDVFSVDIHPFEGIDLVADIEFLRPNDIDFIPDVIWASPPCTTYSIAAISHHRDGQKPKTAFAEKSDRIMLNLIRLINYYDVTNDALFFIENPRGMMHKMWFMQGLTKKTITYCSYGDTRMKPTTIFSNNIYDLYNQDATWIPKPMCFNNNKKCHHESAPRGSRTGTQGLKNNYERSKIPSELCLEILESCEKRLELVKNAYL